MTIEYKITNKIATLEDQEEVLNRPYDAFIFAELNIPGTDIEKCQLAACKDPYYAYKFARDISGADIEFCRKACESDPKYLKEFDKMIAEKVLS